MESKGNPSGQQQQQGDKQRGKGPKQDKDLVKSHNNEGRNVDVDDDYDANRDSVDRGKAPDRASN